MMSRSLLVLFAVALVARSDAFDCSSFAHVADCEGLKNFWTHVGEGNLMVPSAAMHFCDLSWVDCDDTRTHVTVIDVRNQGLSGTVPTCVGKAAPCYDLDSLVKLQHLLLSNNQFTGPIPDTLQHLAELKTLSLSGNQFTGAIPTWFSSFTELQQLDVSQNSLSGVIDCAAFAGLVHVNKIGLANNQFSGNVPECFGHMPKLADLNINDNQFTRWSTTHDPVKKPICSLFPAHPRQFGVLSSCSIAGNPLLCGMPECASACGINPATDCDHDDGFDVITRR